MSIQQLKDDCGAQNCAITLLGTTLNDDETPDAQFYECKTCGAAWSVDLTTREIVKYGGV